MPGYTELVIYSRPMVPTFLRARQVGLGLIVISKSLKRHSKAKRRAPAYSRALQSLPSTLTMNLRLVNCTLRP